MKIHVYFQDNHPFHPLEQFTLNADELQIVPQIGDVITNGQSHRTVKGREIQYGENEVTVALTVV